MVCCAGDLLINPTSLIALPARLLSIHYPLSAYPLSAFCLCARSDAKPGKALSPVGVIYLYAGFKWSHFFAKITD